MSEAVFTAASRQSHKAEDVCVCVICIASIFLDSGICRAQADVGSGNVCGA
jgi:hypothetical protein